MTKLKAPSFQIPFGNLVIPLPPHAGQLLEAMSDDERQIRKLIDKWMAASKTNDIEAVLELMTDDVVFMTPGRPLFGKDRFAIDGKHSGDFTMEGRCDIHEIEICGNFAYIRNYIQFTISKPDEPPVRMSGYTLGILRKESDGQWRLARDANFVAPEK